MKVIPEGYRATLELSITPAMTVDFEQPDPRLGKLHPVYATYWMVKHMELVSRMVLLPFLDDGEEGVGHAVSVRHLSSALPGMRVTVSATHVRSEKNRLYTRCDAVSELGDRIGEGEATQVILSKERLERAFRELRERWEVRGK